MKASFFSRFIATTLLFGSLSASGQTSPKVGNMLEGTFAPTRPEVAKKVEQGADESGEYLRIKGPGPVALSQSVPLPEGATGFVVEGEVRVQNLAAGKGRWDVPSIGIGYADANDEKVGEIRTVMIREDQDWTSKSATSPVPEGATAVVVYLQHRGKGGTADFRNVTLKPAAAEDLAEVKEKAAAKAASTEAVYQGKTGTVLPRFAQGAQIDESTIKTVIQVRPDDAPATQGTRTLAEAVQDAQPLLRDGTPTKLLLASGTYRPDGLEIDYEKIGGKAKETLLVIEGESAGSVLLLGTKRYEAKDFEVFDAEKGIYRMPWKGQRFVPSTPTGYKPATAAVSRKEDAVFLDGKWLKPVVLEQMDYVETGPMAKSKDGYTAATPGKYEWKGYLDPSENLAPGSFATNELGPTAKHKLKIPLWEAAQKTGHPHPHTMFVRLPEGMKSLDGVGIEIGYGVDSAFVMPMKDSVVLRNLVFRGFANTAVSTVKKTGWGQRPGIGQLADTRNWRLDHCRIENSFSYGLVMWWWRNFEITDCEFDEIGRHTVMTFVQDGVVRRTKFTNGNVYGALSGHVVHGCGGLNFIGRNILFEDDDFVGNFGTGFRADHWATDLIFRRCKFNQNTAGGGVFFEISSGPVLMENCEMIANEGFGLQLLNQHRVTLRNSTLAFNATEQIQIFTMNNRGGKWASGGIASGTWEWSEDSSVLGYPRPIRGVNEMTMENCVVIGSAKAPIFTRRGYTPDNPDFVDWFTNQFKGSGNVYWAADGTTDVFAVSTAKEDTFVDFATWQKKTDTDSNSKFAEPQPSVPPLKPMLKGYEQRGKSVPTWAQ